MTDILSITGGKWLKAPSPETTFEFSGICDDSRKIQAGNLFIAICGELSDGHRYVSQAAASGAAAVCVQTPPEQSVLNALQCPCLLVADTLVAFQKLALAHRRSFKHLTVLGITGSCGKTSSKEMCAAILERHWPNQVLKTIGNTNNHFGVPRNLLRITEQTRAAVIEMGSNHPGEIANLVSLSCPDIGLICNIGHAHLEFFHDLRGVATEKSDLFSGLPENGIAILPGEAEGVDILKNKAGKRKILTFGRSPENDLRGEYLGYSPEENAFSIRISWKNTGESRKIIWNIGGAHQAVNAAGAAAAATALGISPDEIADGLANCQLPGARLNVQVINGVHWANDAYNANPDSMAAALDWFAEVAANASNQILVLGEMRELGPECSLSEHAKILEKAQKQFPNARIITVGSQFKEAAEKQKTEFYADIAQVHNIRSELVSPDAWILLKGSNGVKVYSLME